MLRIDNTSDIPRRSVLHVGPETAQDVHRGGQRRRCRWSSAAARPALTSTSARCVYPGDGQQAGEDPPDGRYRHRLHFVLSTNDAYFTAGPAGRPCSPAGPEVARGFRTTQATAMTAAVTAAGTTGAYGCAYLSIKSPRQAPAAMPTMEATRRRAEYAVSDQVTRPLNRSM